MSYADLIHALQTSVPAALGALALTLSALVGLVVKVSTAWRKATTEAMKSVPPTPAETTNPFGHAAPSSSTIAASELQAHVTRTIREMQLTDLREEMAAVRRDMAAVSDDYRRAAAQLVAAQVQLDAARAKVATLEAAQIEWQATVLRLERERDRADARALAATRELARCKQEAGSSNSTTSGGLITPLIPRAKE